MRERLNDPDSYKYASTSIASVDELGEHGIFVKFRAGNVLGGVVVGEAYCLVDTETCGARFVTFVKDW